MVGLFSRRGGEASAPDNLSGEPTESVALTVWILTIADSANPPADELSSKLAERAGNLSQVVGSIGDVRELVGQLKVAGLLRKRASSVCSPSTASR